MKNKFYKALFVTVAAILMATGLMATVYTNIESATISRSLVNSTPIGNSVPSSGVFTTLNNNTGAGSTFLGTFVGNITGNVTGNASGNAGTASALASAPTTCPSLSLATGIGANGNAICPSTHFQYEAASFSTGFCTTAASAYATCNSTLSWPTAFFDGNYAVSCSSGPGQGSSAILTGAFVTNLTSTGFTLTLQNGTASGAGATTINFLSCVALHQ